MGHNLILEIHNITVYNEQIYELFFKFYSKKINFLKEHYSTDFNLAISAIHFFVI